MDASVGASPELVTVTVYSITAPGIAFGLALPVGSDTMRDVLSTERIGRAADRVFVIVQVITSPSCGVSAPVAPPAGSAVVDVALRLAHASVGE